jgi:hypothetical protein
VKNTRKTQQKNYLSSSLTLLLFSFCKWLRVIMWMAGGKKLKYKNKSSAPVQTSNL